MSSSAPQGPTRLSGSEFLAPSGAPRGRPILSGVRPPGPEQPQWTALPGPHPAPADTPPRSLPAPVDSPPTPPSPYQPQWAALPGPSQPKWTPLPAPPRPLPAPVDSSTRPLPAPVECLARLAPVDLPHRSRPRDVPQRTSLPGPAQCNPPGSLPSARLPCPHPSTQPHRDPAWPSTLTQRGPSSRTLPARGNRTVPLHLTP